MEKVVLIEINGEYHDLIGTGVQEDGRTTTTSIRKMTPHEVATIRKNGKVKVVLKNGNSYTLSVTEDKVRFDDLNLR